MVNCRDPERTKMKILEEAEKLFAEMGPLQTSVNAIAENAQVNKRMIYHYFGSKEELYKAVLRRNYKKIYEIETQVFEQGDNLVDNVHQAIKDYYYFLWNNPNYVKINAWEEMVEGHVTQELIRETLLVGYEKLQLIYQEGVATGIFKDDICLEQIIISINALCFSTFARKEILKVFWKNEFNKKLEERLEHICQLFLNRIVIRN